jgi:hypothetical protein
MIPSPRPEMNPFEERLFMLLSAGNQPATAYFGLPPDQVVELGADSDDVGRAFRDDVGHRFRSKSAGRSD